MKILSNVCLVCSIILGVSCTGEEISNNNQETDNCYILKAYIGEKEPVSRATVSNVDGKSFMWQTGDKFDMYLNDAPSTTNEFAIIDNTISNDVNSADFSCGNFQVSENSVNYTAFYPAGKFVYGSGKYTFEMPDDVYTQTGNNSTEHLRSGLVMVANGNYNDGVYTIEFKHKASLIRFGVTNRRDVNVVINSIKLVSTVSCFGSGYSYAGSAEESYNAGGNSINISFNSGVEIQPDYNLKSYTLAMRGDNITDDADFHIEAELSDGTTVISQTFKGSEINNATGFDKANGNYWLPGYYYSFYLDLKENTLDFSGVTCSITGWTDDSNSDKGAVTPDIN